MVVVFIIITIIAQVHCPAVLVAVKHKHSFLEAGLKVGDFPNFLRANTVRRGIRHWSLALEVFATATTQMWFNNLVLVLVHPSSDVWIVSGQVFGWDQ